MIVQELYQDNEVITFDSYLNKFNITDIDEFTNPNGKYIEPYFNYEDIPYAIQEFEYWTKFDDVKIVLIQDGDCDGVCSTVLMYEYLLNLNPNWNIKVLLHTKKQRGLDDKDIMNEIESFMPQLVIIPDAGTNDYLQAEKLCELNIGLIVLDHHDYSTPIQKGILINNQNPNYNVQRNGSGTLVVHKFLQALDEHFSLNLSSNMIDMVALSLVSDSMDMSEMENRTYYYYGLETIDRIHNPFLKALVNEFIGNDTYSQRDLSFKVVPKINSVCRHHNQEYKQRLFLAFVGLDDIGEVLELCSQIHKEQIETVNAIIENNIEKITELSNNNIVIFESEDIPRSYSGLVCGKIMNLCNNKPSLCGKISDDGEFIGSLRSPIPLRQELENNQFVQWCRGHEQSAGVCIKKDDIQNLIDYYNSIECDFTPHISVLKSYSIKSIPNRLFGLFGANTNALWGKGLDKPRYHIHNIVFNPKNDISIIGKNKRTIKIKTDDVDILIFNATKKDKEDLCLGYYEDDVFVSNPLNKKMSLELIGELSINNYKNKKTNQIIVNEFEVTEYKQRSINELF